LRRATSVHRNFRIEVCRAISDAAGTRSFAWSNFKAESFFCRRVSRLNPHYPQPSMLRKMQVPTTKLVERDFPHHVDMMVPEFGFGAHLDAMYDWHLTRGVLALHGSGWRDENGRNWIRWCFVDPKLAEAFAAEFAAFTVKK
jgi:hypothetical protein